MRHHRPHQIVARTDLWSPHISAFRPTKRHRVIMFETNSVTSMRRRGNNGWVSSVPRTASAH